MPSQLVTIVTAVVTSTVLLVLMVVVVVLVVVVVVPVVVMVTMWCRRQGKEGVYKDNDANRGVRFQGTQNTIKFPMNVDPAHFHHQPHPLHPPYTNTTSALSNTDNGDYNSMQDCPAYQPTEDTPTWSLKEYTYISV